MRANNYFVGDARQFFTKKQLDLIINNHLSFVEEYECDEYYICEVMNGEYEDNFGNYYTVKSGYFVIAQSEQEEDTIEFIQDFEVISGADYLTLEYQDGKLEIELIEEI